MEKFKDVLRYLFIAILTVFIFLLVLIYPLVFSLYSTVIDQQNVIKILRDSNAYSSLPQYIFENQIQSQKQSKPKDKIDETIVKKLLKEEEVQNYIQNITEGTINQIYSQVKAKKSNISVQMDVLKIKTIAFTVLIKTQKDSKTGKPYTLTELFKCTVVSRIDPNSGCNQDIVKINKGFDEWLKNIDKNYKPGDTTITLININQPLIPILYTNALIIPFIILFLTLLLIVIDVLLFNDKKHALLETGIDILLAGVINLILWLVVHNNVDQFIKSLNINTTLIPLAATTLKMILSKYLFYTNLTLIISSVIIALAITIQIISRNRYAQKSTQGYKDISSDSSIQRGENA